MKTAATVTQVKIRIKKETEKQMSLTRELTTIQTQVKRQYRTNGSEKKIEGVPSRPETDTGLSNPNRIIVSPNVKRTFDSYQNR